MQDKKIHSKRRLVRACIGILGAIVVIFFVLVLGWFIYNTEFIGNESGGRLFFSYCLYIPGSIFICLFFSYIIYSCYKFIRVRIKKDIRCLCLTERDMRYEIFIDENLILEEDLVYEENTVSELVNTPSVDIKQINSLPKETNTISLVEPESDIQLVVSMPRLTEK